MIPRAESVRVAHPLFQAERGGSTPTSALQLHLYRIDYVLARQLNALWHSRFPRLTSPQCRVSYAAEYDGLYYAVAIWGRPIARNLPQYDWLELRRFAISPDAPPNTASRLLAVMSRLIRKEFPDINTLISYQDEDAHAGTIYQAAGWSVHASTPYRPWNQSRDRMPSQSTAAKIRWQLSLRK